MTIAGSVKDEVVSSQSLFERIGGEAAVDAAVERFYERLLGDKRVRHFFQRVDIQQLKRHQKRFLTMAFGGPKGYTGRTLREAHGRLGITDADFGAVAEQLQGTLQDLGVVEGMIHEAWQQRW